MRVALTLVSLCLLLTLGAFGLFLTLPSRPDAGPATIGVPGPATASAGDEEAAASELRRTTGELLARMDDLARDIDDLQTQVAALRAGAERRPVEEPAREVPATADARGPQREMILKVIEDARQDEERRRAEEQEARTMQMMLARAERTAQRFGLNPVQQRGLADVYLAERQKMEELRTQIRDQGGFGGDPQSFRDGFREVREWRLNELTTLLGPDLAQQIDESEFDGFRGGRRGGRGRDGGDGGGSQGGGF